MDGSLTTMPFPFGEDKRIGRPEIDGQIGRKQTEKRAKIHYE